MKYTEDGGTALKKKRSRQGTRDRQAEHQMHGTTARKKAIGREVPTVDLVADSSRYFLAEPEKASCWGPMHGSWSGEMAMHHGRDRQPGRHASQVSREPISHGATQSIDA